VEPTSRCNLHCRFCPSTTGMARTDGAMELELFKRLVDEIRGHTLLMLFWDWGEPFLNPHAYEMIRYARQAGIRVASSTNGHVFANRMHAKKVVEAGLDALVFSVDGVTQAAYERFRSGGRLETVLEGIRNVVAEKRVRGSSVPLLNLRYIVMKHGEADVSLVEDFARSLGVEVLTIRKFHAAPGSLGDAQVRDFLPADSRYQLPRLTPEGNPVRVRRNSCRNLWNCPTVHWDGTVCSCFQDFDERNPLGSLKEQTLSEIWSGEPYRSLRRRFRRGWRELPLCGQCACGFDGGAVGRESNAEAIFFTRSSV
jgi:MoaA/NifB/PqqE/SkfB family radical SAM enzyme